MAGIGPKRAAVLEARGIVTAGDLVFHLPARYQDWRERTSLEDLRAGNVVVVEGDLGKIFERPMRGSRWRRLASGWLNVAGRQIRLVWFNLPAYMRGYLPGGERVLVRGRVATATDGGIEIVQPELHRLSDGEPKGIRPVYRLPPIVGQRLFASLVTRTLAEAGDSIRGAVPEELRDEIPSMREALRYLHDPPSDADVEALANGESRGHQALAFDELFAFELALSIERVRSARRVGFALDGSQSLSKRMLAELPFSLTRSQMLAIGEIGADLARPNQMNRMLMGDVGSGKTIVAFWAMLRAIECGHQAAMMAPTELLAEQHYRGFARACAQLNVKSALLTGGVTGTVRKQVLRGLASGEIGAVFGTHALIQERVRMRELALGVIDEQHRFGVFDRAKMKAIGPKANLLMMTATPIPPKPGDESICESRRVVLSTNYLQAAHRSRPKFTLKMRSSRSTTPCAWRSKQAGALTISCRSSRAIKTKPSRSRPRRPGSRRACCAVRGSARCTAGWARWKKIARCANFATVRSTCSYARRWSKSGSTYRKRRPS